MKRRKLTPEILDELPADDPEAIRSRKDLRFINLMMGNYQWIASKITPGSWLEIGAGDGALATQVHERETITIEGVDFAPRPEQWPEPWSWHQGDLFAHLSESSSHANGMIANLFLHHFTDEQLQAFGKIIPSDIEHLLISEPARYTMHTLQGKLGYPFFNRVTRHDMIVSIEAGFREQELPQLLGLTETCWQVAQTRTILGAYRLEAHRI